MKNIKAYIIGGFALAIFVFTACSNIFEPAVSPGTGGRGNNGLVRIVIGGGTSAGSPSARTVQPGHEALAGYQLTFAGPDTRGPVDITGGNSAEVTLDDGTWTITATAYKSGGVIGNTDDGVASGSIEISLSNGEASGTVPPIILRPSGNGDGTLRYDITAESGVSGYMKLWEINGTAPVNGFGTGGVVNLSGSVTGDFTLAAGRYIGEVKLTNGAGDIAFLREVIEIWAGTSTAFVFAPAEYVDPNAALASSGATLSEADTKINGIAIGGGTGSGLSEDDPKTYTFSTANAANVTITLGFEPDSLFPAVSWAVTAGTAPDGAYPGTGEFPTDFSANNVLWVKAVSEDGSTTRYYKFVITPPPPPGNGSFTDENYNANQINGTARWVKPSNLSGINGFRVYYGSTATVKWHDSVVADKGVFALDSEECTIPVVSFNAQDPIKYILVYSYGSAGDYPGCLAIPVIDLAMAPTSFGDFTVTGTNPAGIAYTSPNLTITQSGIYYITGTGTETSDRIRVLGDNITADIVLKDVNINVSGTTDAVAFDANTNNDEGVTVNLTIQETNTLRSGNNKAGLHVPSNTTAVIDGTGSLNATGGGYNGGAGIGGGYNGAGGTITVSGGTVTATGGQYGAGIGGGGAPSNVFDGYAGAGGAITITGGTVTTTGGQYGAGIGGGGVPSDYYGGYAGAGGTITITGGTVITTGGQNGAGIGGGGNAGNRGTSGAGGTISITGGTVTATGGTNGAGIGGGNGSGGNGVSGTINTVTGNAVVIASSIQPALPTGGNLGPAIVYIGNEGTMYDDVNLARNVTIPSQKCLIIRDNQRLTIQGGYSLENNGIIVVENGTVTGNVTINQPIQSPFSVSGGRAYTYTNESLVFDRNGTFAVTMKNSGVTNTDMGITVASGVTANITVSDVYIDMSGTSNACAFDMSGATVNLTLTGENVLKSGSNRAGLQAPSGATLVITAASTGSLTATSSQYGAGIGGGNDGAGGTITISGGTVTATGGSGGAGIGGGYNGAGGTKSISGGTVIATAVSGGAGIGGGQNGWDGTTSISGGMVTATGGAGAGIGGGYNGGGGTITAITGNAVVIASSIQPELPSGNNLGPAIIFNGNDGIMYGDVTLTQNVTFPSGRTLVIKNDQTLTIQSGYVLTNNGTIFVQYGADIVGTITGNPPIGPAFTISGGSAYTYVEGVLTITGNGTYTINGVASTTRDRIVVASGVNANITLSGVNIDMSGRNDTSAFDMTGATVNLTLVGENILRSGSGRAGLQAPDGATLVITGASTGSLTATGGSNGAGIGGGTNGAGGTITIAGGMVTATGYRGIGGGYQGASGSITAITGNAVVFTSSIQPELPTGNDLGPAIVFNGNDGIMYGDVTLERDVTFPSGRTLVIKADQVLTIENGCTLTNNGTIIIDEGGDIDIQGTLIGNQPIRPAFTVSGDSAYSYTGGVLTITGNGAYAINGTASTAIDRIVIASGVNADITLSGVNIDMSGRDDTSAFDMSGATVNLTLVGENVLRSGQNRAGLQAYSGATLIITEESTGSLIAAGGRSAGIGGDTISIAGGTVTAIGNNDSAGIGGGTITISGGTVTATGGANTMSYNGVYGQSGGAGIGGGYRGTGGTVTISGGTVTATGGGNSLYGGAGIGGGTSGAGGTVSITGGTVTATGGSGGAGIGGGWDGTGGTITAIIGNAVVIASSIQPTLPSGGNRGPAIVFNGNTGNLYGDVTLEQDVTFPSGRTLTIPSDGTLTIPAAITLTNNGTISNQGTIVNSGTIAGTGTVSGNPVTVP